MLPLLPISAARWVVLLPGAAQASTTAHPGCGRSAWAGMQEALLCSTSAPEATSGWSCRSVPGGKASRSGSRSSTCASWPCGQAYTGTGGVGRVGEMEMRGVQQAGGWLPQPTLPAATGPPCTHHCRPLAVLRWRLPQPIQRLLQAHLDQIDPGGARVWLVWPGVRQQLRRRLHASII